MQSIGSCERSLNKMAWCTAADVRRAVSFPSSGAPISDTDIEEFILDAQEEIEILKTDKTIKKRVQSQVEKHQKDYYLMSKCVQLSMSLAEMIRKKSIPSFCCEQKS